METNQLLPIYSWFTFLSAGTTIITFLTGILFFSIGKPFGKINDISSIFQVLFMVPLALFFFRLTPTNYQVLGVIAITLGVSGMLISAFGQYLLVIGRIDFYKSQEYFPAGAAIGLWLILISSITSNINQIPEILTWTGLISGSGYLATMIGFLWGGQKNILFNIGAVILGIFYPVWAIWLGLLIKSGTFNGAI